MEERGYAMLTYKTPGVYIEEQPAAGPIQPVGTSTTAFLGPSLSGPTFVPTKITSWTQFNNAFGNPVSGPYMLSPQRYMAYGVRGFFDNGGTVAYIVRVGTAQRAWIELDDRANPGPPGKAIRLQAKNEGLAGNNIKVTVTDAQIVSIFTSKVRKASAPITSASGTTITLMNAADAALFQPMDWLTIDTTTERSQLARIQGNQLILATNLTANYGATNPVRIADLAPNQVTFRVQNGAAILPRNAIQLVQGATTETHNVAAVAGEFVTLDAGLTNPFPLGGAATDVTVNSYMRVRKAAASIASATGNVIQLANASDTALFQPNDWLTIDTTTERSQLDRIRGKQLILVTNLNATYGPTNPVRIADLVPNQRTFRVQNAVGIEPGSIIQLAQGGVNETHSVGAVSGEFVTLDAPLTNGFALGVAAADVQVTSFEFTLQVSTTGLTETFPNLAMDTRHSHYFLRAITSAQVDALVPATPGVQAPPNNRPAAVANQALANGAADDPMLLGPTHFQKGLDALTKIDDVQIVCAPDATNQADIVAHCRNMGDRFAILDAAKGLAPTDAALLTQRGNVDSDRGFAAFYYPWIRINDPSSLTGTDTLLIPPSGHLAGIYSRVDTQRGVHKAPANEYITGAIGLERILNDADQGELNVAGINVLRIFQGSARPIVWGARTTLPKDQTDFRYINVRRLFNFVETSIKLGINWAVFEPNDLTLWKKLNRTITDFLTQVWRSGALFGNKAAQAFYVKIDEELNPPDTRALGLLFVEIGMSPVRPAEFIVVRIGIWDGGSQVSEA
jgi:phage tail sheath protein FI